MLFRSLVTLVAIFYRILPKVTVAGRSHCTWSRRQLDSLGFFGGSLHSRWLSGETWSSLFIKQVVGVTVPIAISVSNFATLDFITN